ncbi:DUF1887 family CARF protein [Methylocaldum sp. 14B]|jgi:hypothetical protein|uniref:Card1-like endonuclease domain-containing protein n=1 Tax=unclassified Methylocaldum TaxID=2622260 RepID=UPI00098BB2D8|nr:DUF1887 family CARF protein [Methylocaldum sp. 14B]
MNRIAHLLEQRGASLDPGEPCPPHWANLARMLASRYPVFDGIRPRLGYTEPFAAESPQERQLCETLAQSGFLTRERQSYYRRSDDSRKVRFLTGGWLEHLAALALEEAGAEAALPSTVLYWKVDEYDGKNEVDVIARRGNRLIFVSCKCLRAAFDDSQNGAARLRTKLMQYVLEADDLADHFGRPGDAVVLVVTTDLIDEINGDRSRYPALFGKARALDVELISLEHLSWGRLLARMKALLGERS